jgi:hypothetical protein
MVIGKWWDDGQTFEFLGGIGIIFVLVRMPFQRLLPVGFLDLVLRSIRLDSCVVVSIPGWAEL